MPQAMKNVLIELVRDYGAEILEDTDRLSQFLEDRCPDKIEETFHLSFALRHLLKRGWHPSAEGAFIGENEKHKLRANLGFTSEEAEKTAELINSAMAAISAEENDEKFVAKPGNLKHVVGGLSGAPRLNRLRKKNLNSGLVIVMLLAMIVLLVFQIGTQRTPNGDELCIAFFAPMNGAGAKASHVRLKAAQLAVEKINTHGIAGGYKLKVVGFDLPRKDSEAVEAVRKVMADKNYLAMIAAADNVPLASLSELADDIEAPLIAASPNPALFYDVSDGTLPYLYTFSLVNDTNAAGKLISYFATQGLVKKRIAIYHNSDDKISQMSAKILRKWAVNFGAEIAAELTYKDKSTTNHVNAMESIADSGADLLILPGIQEERAEIISAARKGGYNGYILSQGYTDELYEYAKEAMHGTWWVDEVSPLDPSVMSVLNAYVSLYNEECPQNETAGAVLAYDAVKWLAYSLQNSPGFRGEAVRHTLLSTKNLALTHATLTIDPRTHAPLNKAMSLVLCAKQRGIFQRRIRITKEQ